MVNVRYVGNKPLFIDHLYGSCLTFTQGQVRVVPSDLALKLLKHPEFVCCVQDEQGDDPVQDDTQELLVQAKATEQKQIDEQIHVLNEIDVVNQMSKAALSQYAFEKYQQKLNSRQTVEELRKQVADMVYQFGVV